MARSRCAKLDKGSLLHFSTNQLRFNNKNPLLQHGCLTYCEPAGKYFVYSKERKMPGAVYDEQMRSRLWQVLEEQTGVTFPV